MNKIVQQKELKGLGGWLVLFQIQIISSLAGAAQGIIVFSAMGMLLSSSLMSEMYYGAGFNPFEMWRILSSPIAIVVMAVILLFALLCVVFFYKKRKVFRVFFILGSAVNMAAAILYMSYVFNFMAEAFGTSGFSTTITTITLALSLLPSIGIMIAFIIALYKSQRVKNTFS